AGGTRALLEAIRDDGAFDVRLSAPVATLRQDDAGVEVVLRDGDVVAGAAAVVAVPWNTLGGIDFEPALSEGKRAAASEGQASRGLKTWIRVRGESSLEFASGPPDRPLSYVHPAGTVDGDTLFVAFGSDAHQLDPGDRDAVASAFVEMR